MSYLLQVLKDNPIGFWPLDEASGTTISDRSSSGNNGTFSATITDSQEMPLVYGITRAFKNKNETLTFNISKNLNGKSESFFLSNDNDFSLEAWVYPQIYENSQVLFFADENENVKIYYDNGTIFFSVYGDEAKYTLPNISQSIHVVGTYTPSAVSLYIDGDLVDFSAKTSSFNESVSSFISGPTLELDYYLANAFAIYRYALTTTQIQSHYTSAQSLFPIQVVSTNSGSLFELSDDNLTTQFTYSYPGDKSWEYFNETGLYLDVEKNNLSVSIGDGSPQTIEIFDLISIPSGVTINDSKIEWDGDNGIKVESSLDNITYTLCKNGQSIPGYKLTSDGEITNRYIYIKITFETTDDSKYNPSLNYLIASFYNNQVTYSTNSSSYIKPVTPSVSYPTVNFSLGNYKYPILSRHSMNGIRLSLASPFNIYSGSDVSAIEFFYTPSTTYNIQDAILLNISPYGSDILDAEITTESQAGNIIMSSTNDVASETSRIFYHEDSGYEFSWTKLGEITSNGVASIFVNGEDKIAETSIFNVFSSKKLHHVIIVLDNSISGTIAIGDLPLYESLYQNICLYPAQLTENQCINNYLGYTNPAYIGVSDYALTLTENDIEIYNNDWIVIQNA